MVGWWVPITQGGIGWQLAARPIGHTCALMAAQVGRPQVPAPTPSQVVIVQVTGIAAAVTQYHTCLIECDSCRVWRKPLYVGGLKWLELLRKKKSMEGQFQPRSGVVLHRPTESTVGRRTLHAQTCSCVAVCGEDAVGRDGGHGQYGQDAKR